MVGRGDEERRPPGRSVEPRPARGGRALLFALRRKVTGNVTRQGA
jgi:hypothetical protein